jgi:hypothetical protein
MIGMGQNRLGCAFYRSGGDKLYSTRQPAQALTCQEARLTNESSNGARAYRGDLAYSIIGMPVRTGQTTVLFGDSPKRKVLCACGVIAEVDQSVASNKISLGKAVECRACRNERIAREREELEKHYSGDGEEEDSW